MKKKLIYAVALPIFALGLASCGSVDYMSHDFDITVPEKDSKATKTYHLDNKEEQEIAYFRWGNQYAQAKDYVNDNYKSIIATIQMSDYANDVLEKGTDIKCIMDMKNNSIYCYQYDYVLTDGKVSSYSKIESKSYVSSENTYTVSTEITLNNFEFGRHHSKASGSVKVVTTHKEDIESYKEKNTISYFIYGGYSNGTLSANDDFTYMYYENTNEYLSEVAVGEHGLLTYRSSEAKSMLVDGKYLNKSINRGKCEYLKDSILNDKYDIKDYMVYDESILGGTSYMKYTLLDCRYDFSNILRDSEQFRSWFTISEQE